MTSSDSPAHLIEVELKEVKKEVWEMRHLLSPVKGEHAYQHYNYYVRNFGYKMCKIIDSLILCIEEIQGELVLLGDKK